MTIDLEDFAEDIIGKAMRGRGVSIRELSEASGVAPNWIDKLLKGEFDEPAARAVAPHLELDPDALADSGNSAWRPEPVALDGLQIFNTPWHDMRVNAFLVWDPATKAAAAFDTGADAGGMIEFAEAEGLKVGAIYLTHTHGDHIADLDRLLAAFGRPPVYVGSREDFPEADAIEHGFSAGIGGLSLEARLTWGHSKGGITYVVTGLAQPVAVVGDALFAGSMGGGVVSYADALATNRQQIFSLPDDTIVCPGHGPMSTVAEEKRHNPFYPEFKSN